jgi:hypothetical protein
MFGIYKGLEDSERSSFGTSCKLLELLSSFNFKNHFLLSFLVYEHVHL